MKLLLTAFEPFGGEVINPTIEILHALPENPQVECAVLPVEFQGVEGALEKLLAEKQPDVLLCMGQAGGRDRLTLERVALNLDDASIPDNVGVMPQEAPIRSGGENALFSTLPVKHLVQRVQETGIPAAVSNTAGLFVCNHVLYTALFLAKTRYTGLRAGFLHVPFLPQQARGNGRPSMPLEDMVRGVQVVVEEILQGA